MAGQKFNKKQMSGLKSNIFNTEKKLGWEFNKKQMSGWEFNKETWMAAQLRQSKKVSV